MRGARAENTAAPHAYAQREDRKTAMPKLIDLRERETVELHAPWWSEAKDEQGRYLERCVVYAVMTEKDEQAIAAQIQPKIRPGQGRDQASITMQQTAYARKHLLLRMIIELTDETGHPFPLTGETIDRMQKRDTAWIAGEIEELNKTPVQPDEEDERVAEELGRSPVEVAEERFRAGRARRVSR